MDVELFKFLGVAGLFLVVMVMIRRASFDRSQAHRAPATPSPIVSAQATESDVPDQRQLKELKRQSAPQPSAATATADPAVRATHHEALDRVAEQAVLLQRHVPRRVEALSHWGGVPLVPAQFEWPHFTPEGSSPRALSFLMQIDCAAIPAEARLGLMPDRGQLYFFMDLDWGIHWKWSVLHLDADPSTLAPAVVPASLPHAYGQRQCWEWPQRDEDWPKLLPCFSFDPILISGPSLAPFDDDDEDDRFVWPGSIDVEEALGRIDGAIADSRYIENRYNEGILLRPYTSFPQDWQAVRIALGHLALQAGRGHLERMAARSGTTQQVEEIRSALAEGLAAWGVRADAADPTAPLDPSDQNAFWDFIVSVQPVSLFVLCQAATASLDATIATATTPESVLDDDAMTLARNRHVFGLRGQHGLHISVQNRMLSAPSDVQGEAGERAREWLMLLQLSSDPAIGHHFAEGVLQFYIRPDDLAARRFDRVDLYATAY